MTQSLQNSTTCCADIRKLRKRGGGREEECQGGRTEIDWVRSGDDAFCKENERSQRSSIERKEQTYKSSYTSQFPAKEAEKREGGEVKETRVR
jgi:hypothetical protein